MMGAPLALADLNAEINHEVRVPDLRLAEALGFADPYMIRRLVDRHREALERFGPISVTVTENTGKRGRPGKTYWLSKRQALFICTKSEAPLATETTIEMVGIFDAWQSGQLANADPAPVLPALKPGLMHMMIGSRLVVVDAGDYAIGGRDEAVVCGHDGKVKIVRGPLEPQKDSPWMGKRFAAGPWRKAKAGHGVLRERPCFTIIGRLIRGDETRRRRLARA